MADTIDQQFIEYIVKALVGKPDEVRIERRIYEKGVLLELYVAADDLGRVIGRNGGTAKSIRTLLRALGVKNDARYNLKIVDTNSDGSRMEPDQPATDANAANTSAEPSDEPTVASDYSDDIAPAPSDSNEEKDAEPATAQPEPEEEKPEESSVDRHREDLKDLTDFDI